MDEIDGVFIQKCQFHEIDWRDEVGTQVLEYEDF